MSQRAIRVPNLRTVKALRGQSLTIDLGIAFTGTLTAWMKKDPNDTIYRSFEVKDNRYLFLSKQKTKDYYDENTLELIQAVEGKWYFDVRLLPDGGVDDDEETVFTGTIYFENNVTDSIGNELTEPNYPWATTFLELQDTPFFYGSEGQSLTLNSTRDGLIWSNLASQSDLDAIESDLQSAKSDITDIETKTDFISVTQPIDLDNIDPFFDSSLDPSLAMVEDVGAIPSGTTIADLQGLTFTQYIEQQNFPTILAYIQDASNLSLGGFSTSSVEVGTSYSFSASMSFDTGQINNGDNTIAGPVSGNALTFKLRNPDGVEYNNNSVTGNSDSHVTTGYIYTEALNKTWTFSATNAVGTTTYTDNKGGTDLVSSIETAKSDTVPNNINKSKRAYFPMFFGMSATDNSSGGTGLYTNSDLTKLVANTASRSVALNGSNEFIYFAYPSSFGDLSTILDGNGFNVTSSFTKNVSNVTSTGKALDWTEEYNIYKTNSVTSVSGQTFQFNF